MFRVASVQKQMSADGENAHTLGAPNWTKEISQKPLRRPNEIEIRVCVCVRGRKSRLDACHSAMAQHLLGSTAKLGLH